jgi:LmbE family N-acetylglucosaminyl deacetylase
MKLLVVVAHPDDETFGMGSVIARAAGNGVTVAVCCATRGERGEARPDAVPAGVSVAAVREGELRAAAHRLGADHVRLLDFEDSGWDGACGGASLCGAPFAAVVDAVRAVLIAEAPDIVVTGDPSGGDGHRDHVRIAQATTAAFDAFAADAASAGRRLYHWCLPRSLLRRWLAHQQGSVYTDVPDEQIGCPDEEITTVVDVRDLLARRLDAIALHASQASPFAGLPEDLRDAFLGTDYFVRARPRWTGGPLEQSLLGSPFR